MPERARLVHDLLHDVAGRHLHRQRDGRRRVRRDHPHARRPWGGEGGGGLASQRAGRSADGKARPGTAAATRDHNNNLR